MKRAEKVIVSRAVTGSIHTPSLSPHRPEELCLEVATPDDARRMPGARGVQNAAF